MYMRNMTTILGGLGAAAALVLSNPVPALGATGTLFVSGSRYQDPPRGCYTGQYLPLDVSNHTDTTVLVYQNADCSGEYVGFVSPDQNASFEGGAGVYVQQ